MKIKLKCFECGATPETADLMWVMDKLFICYSCARSALVDLYIGERGPKETEADITKRLLQEIAVEKNYE